MNKTLCEYFIKEVGNLGHDMPPSANIFGTLSQAKRKASSVAKIWGSILKVEDSEGRLVSYKLDGKWVDCDN